MSLGPGHTIWLQKETLIFFKMRAVIFVLTTLLSNLPKNTCKYDFTLEIGYLQMWPSKVEAVIEF